MTDAEKLVPDQPALHLLVVDGHPLLRAGIRAILQGEFHHLQIDEAGTVVDAIQSIAARHYEMVLFDLNLPDACDVDLTKQFRAINPQVKLLVVSADADPGTIKAVLETGASGFVHKGAPCQTLIKAVRAALSGDAIPEVDAQSTLGSTGTHGVLRGESPGPCVLTLREREVLRHIARGDNTKGIALHMRISPKTVETHRQHIMRKLGTNSVAVLVHYAIRHGLTRV